MRIFPCLMVLLILTLISEPVSATTDIISNASQLPAVSVEIEMEYFWVYGITDTVQLRGDGLVRIYRHVNTTDLFNSIHQKESSGAKLTPYDLEILSMEEGNYDSWYVGKIPPELFQALLGTLDTAGFPDMEETYGDWEVWSITLTAGDQDARVGQVIRDYDQVFENILDEIDSAVIDIRNSDVVDEETYIDWFNIDPSLGGVS